MARDWEQLDALERHVRIRGELARRLGPKLESCSQLDWRRRAFEVAVFGMLLLAGLTTTWRWVGVLAAALAMNAFLLLLHEGMHGLLARSKSWNRLLSVGCGALLAVGFSSYRLLHIRHHRFLGDERDPDDYDNYSHSPTVVWMMHFMRLTIASPLYLVMIPLMALRHGSWKERREILEEYFALACLYAAVAQLAPSSWLFGHWFVPLLLVGIFTNVRGLSQHGVTDARDPLLASRSIHLPQWAAFFVLNENLHLEHHLFPEVPSYHLARLHQRLYPMLPRAVVNRSYQEFLWRFFRAVARGERAPIGKTTPSEVGLK